LALQYLLNSIGTAQYGTEAFNWYKKAANQGYAKAQKQLGDAYFSGRGVAENKVEAIEKFRLPACAINSDGEIE
jgi:TPR repeat protein